MLHATLQVLSHIQPLEPGRVFLMNVPHGSCCLGQDLLVFIKVMASSSIIPWRIPQVMQLNNDIARNSRLGWMLTVCDIPSAPPEHGNLSSLLVINIRECVKVNIFSNAVFLFFLIHTFLGIMYKLPNMQFPLLSLRSQRAKLPI